MINIYDAVATDFSKNGLAILSPVFCQVTEELNGAYELEMQHPYDSREKWRHLVEGNIIKAPTQDGTQLFRIYKKHRTLSGVNVFARHIFYDLENNFLEDVRPTGTSGQGALTSILGGTQYPHRFTGVSDVQTLATAYLVRVNPVEAIMKTVLERWGGELVRDNFTVKLMRNRGLDRGVTIRYGKNLLAIEEEIDLDSVVTRIMPQGYDGLFLPEKYVDSPLINHYPHPKILKIEYPDIKIDTANGITEAMAIQQLREAAQKEFTVNRVDIPVANYKVSFMELSRTEEYKDYSVLETVKMADTVKIKHERYGFNIQATVIKTVYDSIALKLVSTSLGSFKENMGGAYQKIAKELNRIAEVIVETKGDFTKAIDHATNQITGALGGNVVLRPKDKPSEILIMDTDNVNTAKQVWRWNSGGFGHSSSGINGPYDTAITQDGHIVAKFITGLVITGEQIATGIIKSLDGSIVINLSNGSFVFGGKGNTAEHTKDYSKFLHPNGSYTKIGWDGLERFVNGEFKKYKYLTVVGTGTIFIPDTSAPGAHSVDIVLPAEFADGDYEVVAMLKDTGNVADRMHLSRAGVFAIKSALSSELNRFTVFEILNISDPTQTPRQYATNVSLEFSYIAIR